MPTESACIVLNEFGRLVCGSLFGIVVSIYFAVYLPSMNWVWLCGTFLWLTITFALLALRYGDSFWHSAIGPLRGLY